MFPESVFKINDDKKSKHNQFHHHQHHELWMYYYDSSSIMTEVNESKDLRLGQVKYVEGSLYKTLLGPFLDSLSQINISISMINPSMHFTTDA